MTMNPNDKILDDLFAQGRATSAQPSDDLVARVLADADAVQAGAGPAQAVQPKQNLWMRMTDALGGWPAVSGLAAATLAGVWIGVAPPAAVQDITATFVGDAVSVNLFPTEFDFDAGVSADG